MTRAARAILFIGFVGGLLIAARSRPLFAASAFSETKRVVMSTTPASPTLISAASNYKRTTLINPTTYWCLFGDARTVFNSSASTGTARVTNATFSPDAVTEPYQGAVYGVCENVAAVIDCIRIK